MNDSIFESSISCVTNYNTTDHLYTMIKALVSDSDAVSGIYMVGNNHDINILTTNGLCDYLNLNNRNAQNLILELSMSVSYNQVPIFGTMSYDVYPYQLYTNILTKGNQYLTNTMVKHINNIINIDSNNGYVNLGKLYRYLSLISIYLPLDLNNMVTRFVNLAVNECLRYETVNLYVEQ